MKRFITFGSIDQFRTIIKNVQHTARYLKWDEVNQVPVYSTSAPLPKIIATGSEKIHGSNAAVCYSNPDGFWVQSRKNIITPEKDNAGCAFQAEANRILWLDIIFKLSDEYLIDLDENIISVYFEWSGGNIQKKSALTGLDKRAMIFQYFKVSPIEPVIGNDGAETPESAKWLPTGLARDEGENKYIEHDYVDKVEYNIFNVMNFPTFTLEIDFERPDLAQNEFIKMIELYEKNSLVGRTFNIENNILEGFVWTFVYKDTVHRFKVKGEEHSVSKVKTLKPVDSKKEQAKIDFAKYACPA